MLCPAAAAAVADIDGAVPEWHSLAVPAARELEDELFGSADPPPVADVTDLGIDGPGGQLPIRVYRPDRRPAPTVVFYHGGGFVLGTLDSVDGLCRRLCRRVPALILSVDYRLAPEHPFPAALDDAIVALEWASDYASDLGGTTDQLVVAGTSAGGTLATSVARYVTRNDGPSIDRQILAYPMIDPDQSMSSQEKYRNAPLLSAADVSWFWEQYLRSPVDRANPYASPARAETHAGHPPATILTAGVDVLGDEGRAYAKGLLEADVPVEHEHYPHLPHGFLSLTDAIPSANAALDQVAATIDGSA